MRDISRILAARSLKLVRTGPFALAVVVVLALGVRLYGLNWDSGHHLHPDERFISLVDSDTRWPSIGEYFDTRRSPLNPNRRASYAYGTFPLFLGKAVAGAVGRSGYDHAYLVGRALTVVFDVGTVLLVFAIGSLLWSRRVGLLAALLVSLSVLHIQLAHFWTVDPYLTFFATATLLFSIRVLRFGRPRDYVAAGLAIGLGLASKVTAFPLLVVLVAAAALRAVGAGSTSPPRREWLRPIGGAGLAAVAALLVFRIAQPYAFTGPHIWNLGFDSKFLAVLREQRALTGGTAGSPPFVQWAGRPDYVFPLENMLLFGMGAALGTAVVAGFAYGAWRLFGRGDVRYALPLLLTATIVGLYGGRFATFARYFEPAYPALVLLAAAALVAGADWGRRRLRAASRSERVLGGLLTVAPVVVVVLTGAWAAAFLRIYSEPNTRIEASQWINEQIPEGRTLAAESWDDPLPLSLPGANRRYELVTLEHYGRDSSSKMDALVDKLARIDYVVLSSDRVRKSIPRIPAQYPATIRYYRALDDGSLGFQLVARFERPPRLLGVNIPDDWAEESLSVYDHPIVRIYRRTAAFSVRQAREVLQAAHPDRAVDLTPRQGDFNGLLLTEEAAREQQAGGGWKGLFGVKAGIGRFAPGSFARDHPALTWFLVLELLALAAAPLVLQLLRPLADRGYALSKPLGLLFLVFPVWLAVWVGLVPFRGTVIVGWAAFLVALGAAVAVRTRTDLVEFIRRAWPSILLVEALFAGVFLAFVALRTANPDLWHPFRGGEKPMDFAYLNAVVKSTTLPPYDPWFAGGYLNYYYFGQFVTATLVKPLGIAPEVAYNLAVPMFAALTAVATFSLASNLVAAARGRRKPLERPLTRGPLAAGLLATLLVLGVGNLDAASQWANRLEHADRWHLASGTWFPGRLLAVAGGLWHWLFAGGRLEGFDWWGASRVIPDSFAITEFPLFSFLLADLHAHLMAMPFAITTAGVSLAVVLGARTSRLLRRTLLLGLLAVLLAALRATNTWDVPVQLAFAVAAVVAAVTIVHQRRDWLWARSLLGHLALLLGAAWLVSAPFSSHFQQFSGGLTSTPETTPLAAYLVQFGLLLTLAAGLVFLRAAELLRRARTSRPLVVALLSASLAAIVLASAFTRYGTACAAAIAAAATGVLGVAELRRRGSAARVCAYAGLVTALLLSAGVELVRVENDIGRQNTVFKFYVQVWWLLAVVAAFSVWLVIDAVRVERVAHGPSRRAGVVTAWAAVGALLLGASMLYPLSGIPARLGDRFASTPRTLDGTVYMPHADYGDPVGSFDLGRDYEAIVWMREHVAGSPVILEGITPLYRWGNRFSVYTGLPAVVGWDFHQQQQRLAYAPLVDERRASVDDFYRTGDQDTALRVLDRFAVRYVVVGQLERRYYPRAGIRKIPRLPGLRRVYDRRGVAIYRVDEGGVERALGAATTSRKSS